MRLSQELSQDIQELTRLSLPPSLHPLFDSLSLALFNSLPRSRHSLPRPSAAPPGPGSRTRGPCAAPPARSAPAAPPCSARPPPPPPRSAAPPCAARGHGSLERPPAVTGKSTALCRLRHCTPRSSTRATYRAEWPPTARPTSNRVRCACHVPPPAPIPPQFQQPATAPSSQSAPRRDPNSDTGRHAPTHAPGSRADGTGPASEGSGSSPAGRR